jgi:acetyl-CoA carboxylase biotin carboxyl carrier protein
MVAIRAPMLGTFYRAPAPGSPAFVEVGDSIKPEDTVCLIEVMKLFNTIRAGVGGKVVRIPAHNAATVRRDQILLIIQPG